MKLWLKAPDSNRQCCGCDGKTSPCDSCCPLISGVGDFESVPLQQAWNAYTTGFFKDKLLKYCSTGTYNPITTITGNFVFTDNNTTLQTISSASDHCQLPNFGYTHRIIPSENFFPPPDLLQLESHNAEFHIELTINNNEYIKLGSAIQQPTSDVVFYDAFTFDGVAGPGNSYTGTQQNRFIQAISHISLQTDAKYIFSGEGFLKEYFTFDIQIVESGGTVGKGYMNYISYIDPFNCVIVPNTKPNGGMFYQSALSATNIFPDGTRSNVENFQILAQSIVAETIFIALEKSPPYNICPNIPLATFFGLQIQNVGLFTYGKYKISNIKKIVSPQNYTHLPRPARTETPVGSACININLNNQGLVQLFNTQNVPIPISSRLRPFKFSSLP